jgi:hypothetical protein
LKILWNNNMKKQRREVLLITIPRMKGSRERMNGKTITGDRNNRDKTHLQNSSKRITRILRGVQECYSCLLLWEDYSLRSYFCSCWNS